MTDAEKPTTVRQIRWMGSSRKDLKAMPTDVRVMFGSALHDLQCGHHPDNARTFGEGVSPKVKKLVEDHSGETYRAAYTLAFADVLYVLDVIQKKSKSGKATPRPDINRVVDRYKAAKAHYAANPPARTS